MDNLGLTRGRTYTLAKDSVVANMRPITRAEIAAICALDKLRQNERRISQQVARRQRIRHRAKQAAVGLLVAGALAVGVVAAV